MNNPLNKYLHKSINPRGEKYFVEFAQGTQFAGRHWYHTMKAAFPLIEKAIKLGVEPKEAK